MGMYDYVSVADRLPVNQQMIDLGLDKNDSDFQTKNLGNGLRHFIIQGGRLFESHYRLPDDDQLGGGVSFPYLIDRHYHGTINFYSFKHEAAPNLNAWIEYNATFTHGKLDSIELVEFRTSDNSEQKATLNKIFAQAEANHLKWFNKYLFHTKGWKTVRHLIIRVLIKIDRATHWLQMNLP